MIDRIVEDRCVLAVVLVSLSETTIWDRGSIAVWIIEADGVRHQLQGDGNDDRIFRILVENDINMLAEIILRNRFKRGWKAHPAQRFPAITSRF